MENKLSKLALKLIKSGARIIEFQKFLGDRQCYETTLQFPISEGKVKIYHKTPFAFIIQPDGRIIPDELIPDSRLR